jgi:tetratricopeptide (TPR) repeat protein
VLFRSHGDEIQFLRYLPVLRQQGVRHITLVCKPALAPLFAAQGLADQVVALPAWRHEFQAGLDYWSHPLSLPHWLQHDLERLPARLPYLTPPPDRLTAWRERLPATGLRIGLAWKGATEHSNNAHRSIPSLTTLSPLWRIPGLTFISLQKGHGEDEAAAPPPAQPLLPLGGGLKDFADSAALISQLDLVISIDTATVHLAGALGKPCWVLLPWFGCDWRWLEHRDDSPWYPGILRLFRQAREENWEAVALRVADALALWVQASRTSPVLTQSPALKAPPTRGDAYEAQLRDQLEQNPDHVPALLQLSLLLRQQDRQKEAEAIYLRLIESGLNPAEGYTGLGWMCAARGEQAEAIAGLRQALALQPDNGVACTNLAGALVRFSMQTASPAPDLVAEADALFARSLELAPDNPLVLSNYGTWLYRKGDEAGALQLYHRVLATNPSYPQARYNLAHLLDRKSVV